MLCGSAGGRHVCLLNLNVEVLVSDVIGLHLISPNACDANGSSLLLRHASAGWKCMIAMDNHARHGLAASDVDIAKDLWDDAPVEASETLKDKHQGDSHKGTAQRLKGSEACVHCKRKRFPLRTTNQTDQQPNTVTQCPEAPTSIKVLYTDYTLDERRRRRNISPPDKPNKNSTVCALPRR